MLLVEGAHPRLAALLEVRALQRRLVALGLVAAFVIVCPRVSSSWAAAAR
jgi:hypothetical protein